MKKYYKFSIRDTNKRSILSFKSAYTGTLEHFIETFTIQTLHVSEVSTTKRLYLGYKTKIDIICMN